MKIKMMPKTVDSVTVFEVTCESASDFEALFTVVEKADFPVGLTYAGETQSDSTHSQDKKAGYAGVGPYDIPAILPVDARADNWISFNFARTCEEPDIHGIHFFIDDYQFNRVWAQPDTYINLLGKFQAVMSPDFSTFTDFPKAVQIYNHYRKHWLGRYWQDHGITVIPTISWSDKASFEWCFDGEPVGGTVAVATVGTQASPDTRLLFMAGYEEMLARLRPSTVLVYGKIPEGLPGNIVPIAPYQQRLKQIDQQKRRSETENI